VAAGEEEAEVAEETAAPAEPPEAEEAAAGAEETEAPQADGFADEDPYAKGGLVRRIQEETPTTTEEERPFTTFDWRGRPLS
jgi:hypothetical protein